MDLKQPVSSSNSRYPKRILCLTFMLLLIAPLVSHAEDEWFYTVQKDDNLWDLSAEYLTGTV